MKKKIIAFCALAVTFATTLTGCKIRYEEKINATDSKIETVEERTTENVTSDSIKVRYSNSAYTEYLKLCEAEFEKKYEGSNVELELVEKENYLININTDCTEGNNISDVYLINNDELATAYLAGLAYKVQNIDFTEANYDKTAVNACSYNDTLVAYPLSFKTTFLAYNSEFVNDKEKHTFEYIKNYSDNADFTKSKVAVKRVFNCNLTDLFINYGFLGDGIKIGGIDGCDADSFSICNENTLESMALYSEIIDYFSLDKKIKNDEILAELIKGECIFSLVSTDNIVDLENSEIDFCYEEFADYNGKHKNSPLSIVTAIAVNPYSSNMGNATAFAEFVCSDMSTALYEKSGMMSTNKNVYSQSEFLGIYNSFLKSQPKNKLQYGEQVYPLIEIALHNIASGKNAKEELTSVDEYMKNQLE